MIRPSIADDLPDLEQVIDAVELFPSHLLADMMAPCLSGADTEAFWLTFDDGAPRGVAYVVPERLTDNTWNLLLIAVHPDRQGRGHGAAMLRAVEARLIERGGRLLIVETSGLAGFDAQRRFYAGNGYEEEARIRDFYEAGNDKVVFRKALT